MRPSRRKKQVDQLVEMGQRVERLWEIATSAAGDRRRSRSAATSRCGADDAGRARRAERDRHVTREEIEESLADPDGAYRRLRRIMDAWCALWFWPLTEDEIAPPTLDAVARRARA